MSLIAVPLLEERDGKQGMPPINPPDLVSDHPEWVTILCWQGGTANERGSLEQVGLRHYVSTAPSPRALSPN